MLTVGMQRNRIAGDLLFHVLGFHVDAVFEALAVPDIGDGQREQLAHAVPSGFRQDHKTPIPQLIRARTPRFHPANLLVG